MKFTPLILLVFLLTAGCTKPAGKDTNDTATALTEEQLREQADSLAQAIIIADTHVDLPYRLVEQKIQPTGDNLNVIVSTREGDFDYERAKQGGLDAPFMSIYIPASYQNKRDFGKALADSLIDMVRQIAAGLPDKFALAFSPDDIERNTAAGKISLPLGMENGAPIGRSLENIQYFFDRGIRYITLTHSRDNQICDSSYDTSRTWNGLSPFGVEVVREMNRVGIMVDVSHVSDSAFYDVIATTSAPVIASHSSCRHFTPGFERNMSDDMIRALAQNGGVIQINFGATFIDSVARENQDILEDLITELKRQNLTSRDPEAQPIIAATGKSELELYSDVQRVADHIDHVVALVGVDHVGIGSDYDGVDDSLPVGLKDVSQYPNLIFELLKRGYSHADIQKICYGNLARVWNAVIQQSQGK
ncbi:MAG TPA: dipeptidase [Cyclobacteriaceae bacterium]|nr:dipeptidase [Cyclobacteriaceae bacterium]